MGAFISLPPKPGICHQPQAITWLSITQQNISWALAMLGRRWDWRGTIGLIQLSHSLNFSVFHCTRCRAHFKNWQVKGIMLFFYLRQGKQSQRPHTILRSATGHLCLFTRENFTFESIYPLLNVREKHKTIKKKNFKLLDTPSTQKLPSLIFEVHFLLYFFTHQSIIYFEIISYYLI